MIFKFFQLLHPQKNQLSLSVGKRTLLLSLLIILATPQIIVAQFGSGLYGSGLYGQGSGVITTPTLSAATAAANGPSAFTASVSTNVGSGTLHWLVNQTATTPTPTAVRSANSQPILATGDQNISGSGLTANTTYFIHLLHRSASGNDSGIVTASFTTAATPDTTPPILSLVSGVTTPTTDRTPSFVFSSTESGTIIYSGACSSSQTLVGSGTNTITLNTLAIGTYGNCRIRVTDAAGNTSNFLNLNTFSIEATNPGDTFTAGDRVRVSGSSANVYGNIDSAGSSLGTKPVNAAGVVVGTEIDGFSGNRFVFVNFINGYDGFVSISDLVSAPVPTLTNYVTQKNVVQRGTATTSLSHRNETDINGDGIDDREEERIATLINKVQVGGERYQTLRLHSNTARIRSFTNITEAEAANDNAFNYPLGLYRFVAEVEPGSTETVTIYLDDVYQTSDWVYRKYNTNTATFTNISSNVTYGTAVVDGELVTTISYDIVDNGPLDLDNRLGFILDPAGPGVTVSSGGSSGGAGSGGGTRSSTSSSGGTSSTPITVTATATQPMTVTPIATSLPNGYRFENNISFIQPEINRASDVRNLEIFLNDFEGERLAIDGVYGSADLAAVQRFQNKYRRQILEIWSLTEATGYVGVTTRLKMNSMLSNQAISCPAFVEFNGGRDGIFRSDEVRRTQEILMQLDLFAGPATGFWDPWTHEAMVDFQELFHEVMLDPWNITKGTGFKYKTTNKFLNYFVGCTTPPVELEGVGMYDF